MKYYKCNCCNLELELTPENYHRDSESATGFRRTCKLCRNNLLQDERKRSSRLRGKVILTVSDVQAPYHHPDTIPFLTALIEKYNPDEYVIMGDEVDNYFLSSYLRDPDSDSPSEEVLLARKFMQELSELIPVAKCVKSNHTHGRLYKAARAARIPTSFIKDMSEIYGMSKQWVWAEEWEIDGTLFRHGDKDSKSPNRVKYYCEHAGRPLNLCMAHHHTELGSADVRFGNHVVWRAYCGSLIWRKSEAFSYATSRPAIGTGVIVNRRFIPEMMKVDENERWTGIV
jgi:hypothetical protein